MAQHKKDYKPEDIMFPNQSIITSELVGEMKQSYMEYAMSVIVGRALPDVRDGLKPVHRRISVSYTHLRAHETGRNLVCRLLLEKKKKKKNERNTIKIVHENIQKRPFVTNN